MLRTPASTLPSSQALLNSISVELTAVNFYYRRVRFVHGHMLQQQGVLRQLICQHFLGTFIENVITSSIYWRLLTIYLTSRGPRCRIHLHMPLRTSKQLVQALWIFNKPSTHRLANRHSMTCTATTASHFDHYVPAARVQLSGSNVSNGNTGQPSKNTARQRHLPSNAGIVAASL